MDDEDGDGDALSLSLRLQHRVHTGEGIKKEESPRYERKTRQVMIIRREEIVIKELIERRTKSLMTRQRGRV